MSFLSSNDISSLTGIYLNFFDTFKEQVVVIKEPIKTIALPASSDLWKYGDSSNEQNFSYTQVSGIFNCLVNVKLTPQDGFLNDFEKKGDMEDIIIEVGVDFRNYVSDGIKVQKVLVRDKQFEMTDDGLHNSFLNYSSYNYNLKLIK